jgi:hypothetical protein
MKRIYLIAIAALLAWIPCRAALLTFQLVPGPDLSSPPGGTLNWNLRLENDELTKFLQLDNVSWTVAIDLAQGSDDHFASFPFPILGPQSGSFPTVEIDSLLSVTWLAGATPGYAPSPGNIIISSSFCDDNLGNGCVANMDVLLPVTLSVADPPAGVPEPSSIGLYAGGLLCVGCLAIRRRSSGTRRSRREGATVRW